MVQVHQRVGGLGSPPRHLEVGQVARRAEERATQGAVGLAARGLQAWAIVDLALVDDGGALSSHEAERRRHLLQPLGRAARRAIVAACSPEVWPDR